MSFTRMRYHFVSGTKRRQAMITPEIEPRLYGYMRESAEEADGSILEVGGIEDHVHVVAAIHPTQAPSEFVRRVKSESSRRLCDEHPECDHFAWQSGFAGFTLSPFRLDVVREYVRNQKEHHENESIWSQFELLEEIRKAG